MTYLNALRVWLDRALFDPATKVQWIVFLTILTLIALSILELAISAQYPEFTAAFEAEIRAAQYFVGSVFLVEIVCRLIARPRPRAYLLTWGALIDILAVAPILVGVFVPVSPAETAWLRALRVVRLIRLAHLLAVAEYINSSSLTLIARLTPIMATVFGAKALLLYLETQGLWPHIGGLGTIITVVGFAIGILLSTRLSTVHSRMYTFDERLTHLVGSVEAARAHVSDQRVLIDWLEALHRILRNESTISEFRQANIRLRNTVGQEVPAPIYNSMHQHAQFLIHRARTRTPALYTRLLQGLTATYLAVVIIAIPGLTGLISSILVVYALGGMTLIVNEMDQPVDQTGRDLINSDISRIEKYLENTEVELAG